MNYITTIVGKNKLRVDFPNEKAVLFYEGTASEFASELSTSELLLTESFTKKGLNYAQLSAKAKTDAKKAFITFADFSAFK